MNINLTMIGQMISFMVFVVFCMKFVWPPLTQAMRERRKAIAEGLEKAADAEKKLEKANEAADLESAEAKRHAAELISQAQSRANQIVEEAKGLASEEAERIRQGAQGDIDQGINRAREELREKVSELAIEGAEKILESSIDKKAHQNMLKELSAKL